MRPQLLFRKVPRHQRAYLSSTVAKTWTVRNRLQTLTKAIKKLLNFEEVSKMVTSASPTLTSSSSMCTPSSKINSSPTSPNRRTVAVDETEQCTIEESLLPQTKVSSSKDTLAFSQFWIGYPFSLKDIGALSLWKWKTTTNNYIKRQMNGSSKSPSSDIVIPPASVSSKTTETLTEQAKAAVVSRMSLLDSTTRQLFHGITVAESNIARHLCVEELCRHLIQHPESKTVAAKIGGIRQLLMVRRSQRDPVVLEGIQEALALLGYVEPLDGWGVRILSIDGGGLRGILALEVLHCLEQQTGQPVHRMFDYICGVSTGAILAVMLGALKLSVSDCKTVYKKIGTSIFKQNPIWGTGKLVLSHAFYDTANWTKMIQENIGHKRLIETRRDAKCPKIAAISTVVNHTKLHAFAFRNYDFPARVQSQYRGTQSAFLWEAIRASAAAPGYFEEYQLGTDVHQDGGVLVNNPTALAIHECKHIWPKEDLQCVVSLGCGRYEPQPTEKLDPLPTGLKAKLMRILDSATDTEAVHTTLNDLLPPTVYFRINPYITEDVPMNESRVEKIEQLQQDAKMYLRRNEGKVKSAARLLTEPRTYMQSFKDYAYSKKTQIFG